MSTSLTRRDVLKSGAALASLAVLPATPSLAATRGGRLRIGGHGAHTSMYWDGRTYSDFWSKILGHGLVFDCLTQISASGDVVGELAVSWEPSADAKTWTFDLRKNATFHNGKRFVADDVIASLNLHTAEGAKSAAKPIVEPIVEIKKLTDHQIQFVLDTGNADFPALLTDPRLLIHPAGQIDESMSKGIGSGLYEVVSFDPGVRLVCKRVDDHYKGDTAGFFDEVELLGINDPTARMNALMTGQVDVASAVDFKTEPLLRANRNISIVEVTGNQHFAFPMRIKTPPFNQLNVRKAIKHAFDRQELVDKIVQGHGAIANDHPIGPANQYYASDLPQTRYDPDMAKWYLKQAGLSPLNIDLSASEVSFPGAVNAAQLFQATARGVGINVNVVQEPADGYWSNVWMKKPFVTSFWSGRVTEDWMFSTTYKAGAPWNETQWDHPRFQELLYQGKAELDSEKRRSIYYEMQKILKEEGGVVIPLYANYVDAASTKLAHPDRIGNVWALDNARIAERWWFA